ncbi:growth inhibitor PemK [Nocardioides sp. S5]|uniref:type II toxin-antitoxin system PemK/MazF family toxin n=1 Tax=Nocardioides sp. S5 TaxID=2017486 RepID=UPI001A8BFEC3|nr:type II toxin-antitoxin system PemK/MazF family toxin [Nocardioides sp. S5]QSR32614.1 growth inhibitor PemK [Nocardioides sp. S5]
MSLLRRVAAVISGATSGTTAWSSATPSTAPASGVSSRYAPEIDGEPDPGEVVWAWVPYEDDPSQGKDRPVLVLDTAGDGEADGWVGLMLSSQDHDRDAADEARHGRYWMDVGSGGWDSQGRPSEVRLDRLIHLERDGVRREGAALDARIFDEVVAAVRGLPR